MKWVKVRGYQVDKTMLSTQHVWAVKEHNIRVMCRDMLYSQKQALSTASHWANYPHISIREHHSESVDTFSM